MRKLPRRPSAAELQAALGIIRARLGEFGYYAAPVAKKHRRHESDFVALRKPSEDAVQSNEFAIVRASPTSIVVRPFLETRGNFYLVLPKIKKAVTVPIRRCAPLLNMSQAGTHPWLHYVSDEAHLELIALGCIPRPDEAA
jgi:hypothetical protein